MIRFKTLAAAALLLVAAPTETLADSCSLINSAFSSCQLPTMCSRCVATSGCEYNLMDATCTTSSNSSSTTTYCSTRDRVCASCTVTSSKPTCTGADGSCICPSLCDVVSSSSGECSDSSSSSSASGSTSTSGTAAPTVSDTQNFSMMYVAVALGALCIMILLYMQRRCAERRVEHHMSLVRREMEALRTQRRREREMLRARRPELALNLETWRDHVELHKPQMSKVELETCYYLMMQDDKKKDGKKNVGEQWDSVSEDGAKIGPGAVSSPIASGVADPNPLASPLPTTSPYFAMREEMPSNTTTDGSDGGSDNASAADEEEEKPEVVIDLSNADPPAGTR